MTAKPESDGPHTAVTFWGAAQMVTGSMHLLESGGRKILLDCGLKQGPREDSRRHNARFPFQPRQVDSVIISHAHIDHCGNLPTLVRQGFDGPIYCTPATRDLLAVMLADSAKIQEEDAAYLNIQRKFVEPLVQPLYSRSDVEQVLAQVVGIEYERPKELAKGLTIDFIEAGHVLGSAMVRIKSREGTLIFTGDLGRRNLPLLRPTAPIPEGDVLVCESTYGNRLHEDVEHTQEKLFDAITRTIKRGGKVLIPAFSLGRTQLVIHFLQEGILAGRIPHVPIYVDSPLAADVSEVFSMHLECLSDEAGKHLKEDGVLGGSYVQYIREFEDSQRISRYPDPMIIIASSGMCDAGRIVHHLKQHVDDPRCTVILVSFQAPGTTGRRLMDKTPTVRLMGRDHNKWLEVVHLDGLSAHADRDDFLAYLQPLAGKIGKTRLIHGERDQADALAQSMREMGYSDVEVPQPGDRVLMK